MILRCRSKTAKYLKWLKVECVRLIQPKLTKNPLDASPMAQLDMEQPCSSSRSKCKLLKCRGVIVSIVGSSRDPEGSSLTQPMMEQHVINMADPTSSPAVYKHRQQSTKASVFQCSYLWADHFHFHFTRWQRLLLCTCVVYLVLDEQSIVIH
ncbi:hypothetical protein Pcinc_022727 [Petrolisthes cinctipes]|uniref:Uncharacterized protein n=2 Tax=Petrolisthes cinctipes TaxID=88211 RepID=A0AAE1FE77_PETCI|nr:hypothetical protein Pcinc_022727 [Petrolisthes cinctipes]